MSIRNYFITLLFGSLESNKSVAGFCCQIKSDFHSCASLFYHSVASFKVKKQKNRPTVA